MATAGPLLWEPRTAGLPLNDGPSDPAEVTAGAEAEAAETVTDGVGAIVAIVIVVDVVEAEEEATAPMVAIGAVAQAAASVASARVAATGVTVLVAATGVTRTVPHAATTEATGLSGKRSLAKPTATSSLKTCFHPKLMATASPFSPGRLSPTLLS